MESTVLQFNSVDIHLRADFESGDTFVFGPVDVKHRFSLNTTTPVLQTNSQWVVLIRGKYVVELHNLKIFRNLKLQRHLSEKYHSKLTCHLIWVVQLELTEAVL